jgi:hypothetical protein
MPRNSKERWGGYVAGLLLVLRQAQDEEEWKGADRSPFLMLSLSKHEELAGVGLTPSPNPLPQGGEGLSVLALSLRERVG